MPLTIYKTDLEISKYLNRTRSVQIKNWPRHQFMSI